MWCLKGLGYYDVCCEVVLFLMERLLLWLYVVKWVLVGCITSIVFVNKSFGFYNLLSLGSCGWFC